MKFFVIGDADTVLGFRYAGVPGVVAESPEEVSRALDRAVGDAQVGAIIITERAAAMARAEVDELRINRVTPVVVEAPDQHGPMEGRKTLADLIREAVGIRI